MVTHTQEITQAVVCYGDARVYVPYEGRLTEKKKTKMRDSLMLYAEHHGIKHLTWGWPTKHIVIHRTEGEETSLYQEEGGGGRCKVLVCALDYADANRSQS